MTRAAWRRLGFVAGVLGIVAFAAAGTVAQRRSIDDFTTARAGVRATLNGYAGVLRRGESRAAALAALRAAGAPALPDRSRGDIVLTVLRELRESRQCRSVVGQLHVEFDAAGRVAGWETPIHADCT